MINRNSVFGVAILLSSTMAYAQNDASIPITFNRDISPIIYTHCTSCHHEGSGTPFTLKSYGDVKKRAKMIAAVTADRIMPPWHANASDVAFKSPRTLAEKEIRLLQDWASTGMLEGDPPEPKPPRFDDGWSHGKPDLVLKMPEAFTVPADGPDIYRSFAVPLQLAQDRWVEAIEFRAGARSVVHHCFFFQDTTGKSSQIIQGDGNPGFNVMPLRVWEHSLSGWNFGGDPVSVPTGMAYRLRKGADFVFQTHFHPSGKEEQEVSTVGIYYAKNPPQRNFTTIMLPPVFGAFTGIDIAPGSTDTTVSDSFVLPVDVDAFGVTAHAHYLGKEVTLEAQLPDGKVLTILQIDEWDFNWQEQYTFQKLLKLPKGTVLKARVRFDNSDENPVNPASPPVRVKWGRESTDEMGCITLSVSPSKRDDLELLESKYRYHMDHQMLDRGLKQGKKASFLRNVFKRMDRNANGKFEQDERDRIIGFLKRNRMWPEAPGFTPKR